MKRIIFAAMFIAAGWAGAAWAQPIGGPESQLTVVPIYEEYGNTSRLINVPISTTNVVVISSEAPNAYGHQTSTSEALGISVWRFREIVNTSTCAALALYPDRSYTTYTSSFGIVLSSDSTNLGAGDSYVVPSQTAIYGIWSPSSGSSTCGAAGAGAGGYETYYLQSGRR